MASLCLIEFPIYIISHSIPHWLWCFIPAISLLKVTKGGFPSHVWWPDVACGVSSNITFCLSANHGLSIFIYIPTMFFSIFIYILTMVYLFIYIYILYIYTVPTIIHPHLSIYKLWFIDIYLYLSFIYIYLSTYKYIYIYYRVAIYIGMP